MALKTGNININKDSSIHLQETWNAKREIAK